MASSISESSPLVDTLNAEDYEEAVASSCCGCFQGFCCRPRRGSSNGMEGNAMLKQEEPAVIKDGWLVEKVKKVKEISEVLAGPKWKNFIRRFSNNNNKKRSRMQYQYDLQSYALNFDEGFDREVDAEYPDFSTRYGAPVRNSKGDLTHDHTAVFQP